MLFQLTKQETREALTDQTIRTVEFEGDSGEVRSIRLTLRDADGKRSTLSISATTYQSLTVSDEG